jgi:long-chain acyl-CoA synthetase
MSWYCKAFCIRSGISPILLDKLLFWKIRNMLGGCVDSIICAGAALDPITHEFLQIALGIPIRIGYGLTEVGSGVVCSPDNILQAIPGTAGGPLINVEVRIEPSDSSNDPTSGEILIGGPAMCSGYVCDETLTANLFVDKDRRWVRTGDIGKWTSDGSLKVIDRARSIFKLSQGEYVAAEMITQVYEDCECVQQIFVYGDAQKPCLVAIVIPKRSFVCEFYGKEVISDSEYCAACRDLELVKACQRQMDVIANERGLFGCQWVKSIYLDCVEWSLENNLLTPSLKIRRKALADKYRTEIEGLYKEYEG